MAKTPAQRQADYRAKRAFAGGMAMAKGGLTRWISTSAFCALDRLAYRYGVTKPGNTLERLILSEDDKIVSSPSILTHQNGALARLNKTLRSNNCPSMK